MELFITSSHLPFRHVLRQHVSYLRRGDSPLNEYHDFRLLLDTEILPDNQDALPDAAFQGAVVDVVHMRMEEVD